MNKIFKLKKLQSFFAVSLMAAVFVPTAFASGASFNTDPLDYPTLQAGNYTECPGCTSWSTSVSADAGEIISFMIYYHNTSNEVARQTKVRVLLPTGNFQNTQIIGSVWADNASAAQGSVSVNLSSNQTLTFIPGSVRWYPNRSSSPYPLPFGQNGSEIISSSGLNLGDIGPGWNYQGYVVFRAQVSNDQTPSGQAPTVFTNSAYGVTENLAYLSGTVNPNNSNTDFWFEYGTNPSLGTTVGYQSVGSGNSSITENYYLSGLQSNTTYYFRAVARNQYGTTYGNILSFTTQSGGQIAPTVFTNSASSIYSNSAVLNGSVNPNNSQTDAWFEYGPTPSLGYTTGYRSIGSFNYSTDFSISLSGLSSNTTYYYRAVARNQYGTNYGGILSFTTTGASYTSYSYNQPSVISQAASPVYQNSALLNGSVNPNGGLTTAWFQWGTNYNLSNTTVSQPVGAGTNYVNYAAALTGLSPNTTYYFRAVASNPSGTVYGDILSFTTQSYTSSNVIIQPPQTQTKVVYVSTASQVSTVSTSSLILFISHADKETVEAGEELNYSIVYKNISQQKLSNVVLKATLPTETIFLSSNPKKVLVEGNNITYQIGDLGISEEGTICIKVKTKNSVRPNDTLIFAAVLEYLDKNNNFHSNNHFLAVTAVSGKPLLATLISAGRFNWIWGLILGLIIGFLVYWFGLRKKTY